MIFVTVDAGDTAPQGVYVIVHGQTYHCTSQLMVESDNKDMEKNLIGLETVWGCIFTITI